MRVCRRKSNAILPTRRAYTLVEVLLVVALLGMIAAMAMPNLMRDLEARRLPESARQMRSMLTLVRGKAMMDGKRYRLRFPMEDEIDSEGERRQPLIEREDDPFLAPGVFNRVTLPWARGQTLLRNMRCMSVRLGKPTLEMIEEDQLVGDDLEERFEMVGQDFDEGFPPLYIETDGTSEWASFVITNAPVDVELETIESEYKRIEVILDGLTGLIWLQRPFYEEELDLFKENDWPPVLRRDFLRVEPLTKEQVLEIQETRVRS